MQLNSRNDAAYWPKVPGLSGRDHPACSRVTAIIEVGQPEALWKYCAMMPDNNISFLWEHIQGNGAAFIIPIIFVTRP